MLKDRLAIAMLIVGSPLALTETLNLSALNGPDGFWKSDDIHSVAVDPVGKVHSDGFHLVQEPEVTAFHAINGTDYIGFRSGAGLIRLGGAKYVSQDQLVLAGTSLR